MTGSRVRRKDLSTPAPVTVLTREQVQTSSVANIGDFLQLMPEQGNALNTQVNNGGNGTTQINLRSLGSQRTLVLVDGKRFVQGGGGADPTVDLNSIPTAAVERIEILKDGASAVYGSDAIAGVVNIITRHRMNGTEASAYGGVSAHGDAQVYDINITSGASGDKGGFLFGAGYFDQRAFLSGARDWAKYAIGDAAGGYDYTTPGVENHGGSSRIPQGRYRVDPTKCPTQLCKDLASQFGAGRQFFAFDPAVSSSIVGPVVDGGWYKIGATPQSLLSPYGSFNYQEVNYTVTPSQRISLFTNGEYRADESARFYFQGSLVNRQSSNLLAPEPLDTRLTGTPLDATNPFNPFGVTLGDVRKRLSALGGRQSIYDINTYRIVGGLNGSLNDVFGPAKGFFYDVSFNYGRNVGTTQNRGALDTRFIGSALGKLNPDGTCGTPPGPCVNLVGANQPSDPAQQAALGLYSGIARGFNQQTSAQANLSGELFQLLSNRPAGIALGYEFRREYGGFIPDPIGASGFSTDYNSNPTSGSFYVNEGYGELIVPVLSGVDFVDDFEAQGAIRVFNYNTFGTDYTYKTGFRYRPVRDVTLRGTWSTAFRAPTITELYSGTGPSAEFAVDPCAGPFLAGSIQDIQCSTAPVKLGPAVGPPTAGPNPANSAAASGGTHTGNGGSDTQINSTIGGNLNLKPEKSHAGTLGVVIEPQMVRNFSVTFDYYRVSVTDAQLGGTLTPYILALCYPGTRGTQNTSFCNRITRGPDGSVTNVDDLNNNFGQLVTSGLDLSVRYAIPTDFGRFGFLFDGTYLLQYDQVISTLNVKSAGFYDLGLLPQVKFNTGVTFGLAGLTLNAIGRFVGASTECAGPDGRASGGGFCWANYGVTDAAGNTTPYPRHRIKPQMTFDVNAAYRLAHPLGTSTLAVGVRNLLDTNPVRIYNSFLTYADPSGYDFIGRYFYARLNHTF